MRKCNIAGASWQHPKAGAPEDTEHRHLPPERDNAPNSAKNILQECAARLNRTDARELAAKPDDWPNSEVSQAIQGTLRDLPRLSDTIAASYFAHSTISRTGREIAP